MSKRVEMVGLMRFSVVIAGAQNGYWKNTKGRSLDDIIGTVLDPGRLAQRMRLAEQMPIASLRRQTDADFRLCILISLLMPQPFRSRLEGLAREHSFIQIVEVDVEADIKAVCSALIPESAPCVTFRLDDDDAVGPNHIADLRAMAVPRNEEKVLTFRHGVYMERRGERLAFQRVEYVRNAFGIGFFTRSGRTIFNQGNHASVAEERIVINDRSDAWIRSIHADSDSDTRLRAGIPTFSAMPGDAAALLPDYHGIDFGEVADDLSPFPAEARLRHAARRQVWRLKSALFGR